MSGARQALPSLRCDVPDTLPAAQRRELRLAAQAHAISSGPPQVAPWRPFPG
ncbi:hypothetical protein QUF31_21355 [Dickeya chrysanthemi]|uniref:hypothetical protein n=1 Tax=Dickeya chrysanthemi TaxID=556 RepID=UPI0025A18EB7|nr:hypothetical protein [Dickeya chrysanthemi]WJM85509.1 hypothetical protein QUF31_21355 [Dickeya chrysanthemi]